MSCYPSFLNVPAEIMEAILALLDLPDICSLRLTAREVAAKASQQKFRNYFRHKTINLAAGEQLENAICVTQQNALGCLVEHLTLVQPQEAANENLEEHNAAELLRQAMKNLRLNSIRGVLSSVSLMVEGVTGGKVERPGVWKAAAKCFQTALQALGTSELPIEGLDIFGRITRCSLSCDQIVTILGKVNLSASLKGLKQLSMSLSHHEKHEPESRGMRSSRIGQQYSNGVCQFLQLCPELEDLQLHWFNLLSHNLTNAQLEEQRFFNRVAKSCRFPSLKQCTLKGIYTSGAALLSVLRQVQLTSFEMEEVYLHSGKFRPIFDHLANKMEQLEYLHLEDLWENRIIVFDAPGLPHYSSSQDEIGPKMITRNGADARQPIKYEPSRGRSCGTIEAYLWYQKRLLFYGPVQ